MLLSEQIDAALREHSQAVAGYALRLLNSTCAHEAAMALAAFCDGQNTPRPAELLFGHASSGVVFGLRLENGQKIVIKVHSPKCTSAQLGNAYDLQDRLRRKHIPCAREVLRLAEIAPGTLAIGHDYFAPGDPLPGDHRDIIARGLHDLIVAARDERAGALHSPLDDIDHIPLFRHPAAQHLLGKAKKTSRAVPCVAFHADWKSRNLLFENGRISAIYDFDSMMRGPEAFAVGLASVDYMSPRGRAEMNLDPKNALAFVRDYERAARRSFSADEMDVVTTGQIVKLWNKRARLRKIGIDLGVTDRDILRFA